MIPFSPPDGVLFKILHSIRMVISITISLVVSLLNTLFLADMGEH